MNKLPKRNRGSGPGELKHWSKVEPWPLRLRPEGPRGVACRVARRPISTRNDTVKTPATRL